MSAFLLINSFFLVITIGINFLLSGIVYLRNPRSATNRLFLFLGLTISIWLIVFNISLQPNIPSISLIWIRLSVFFATPMSMLFFLLSHTMPQDKIKLKSNQLMLLLVINFLIMLLTISPYTFTDVQNINSFPRPIPGIGLVFFGLFVVSTSLGAVLTLLKRISNSSGIEKQQLRLIMYGILIMYSLLIGTILLPVALFKSNIYIFFAPVYTLIFLLLTAYAIIKHRFLDIHLIIARSVSYALLLIILAIIYVFGFIILAIFVSREAVNLSTLITSGIFTLTLVFSFQPLRKYLEKITAQTFYKRMYNAQTLLWNMSRIMASSVAISDLTDQILKELTFQMSISTGSIILIRDSNIIWSKQVGANSFPTLDEKAIIGVLNTIVKTSKENILIFDEMYESPQKKVMRDHNISALLALIVQDEVIGAIILSEKASGDIYSLEDISLLKIITPEISVALKNALSYDEIKLFNNTLQKEVSKATDEVKKANEQMYKRNLDLADRNKTLALLRKIDDTILTSVTDTKKIAQKVADLIIMENPIKSILISLVSDDKKYIYELATAPHAIMHMVIEQLNHNYQGVKIPMSEKENLLVASIDKKMMHITTNLYDIVRPIFLKEDSDKLQNFIAAKSHVVYPMIVHGEVIGAVTMGLHDDYVTLSDHQKDLISRLVNVMGIAIDNAMLYQKIAEANERLKQLDLLKDEFVSVASHELRTPMTAIKSYLWLALAEKAGPLNEKLRFYIDRSYISTNRLIKLVNDMLNVSRIESGRMSFDMQKTDLAQLVEDTISEVKPRADELGVNISNKVIKADNTPPALADQDKVKEVLINLIGNSLKFTPKNGTITIWLEQKDGMLITNVTDTGEGLAQEDIPKLFQKFGLVKGSYQTNKQSSQGTGLGLYICKAIMKEQGGDIWAQSEGHGKGATFGFSLKEYNEADFIRYRELAKKDGLGIIHSEV